MRYVGQEIALVVASSQAAAQDAAEKIEIGFDELPAVVEGAAALEPGAVQLHADVPGNLAATYEYGDEKAAADAFAGAAHVVRLKLDSTRVSGTPMEPGLLRNTTSRSKRESMRARRHLDDVPTFVAITGVRGAQSCTLSMSAAARHPLAAYRVHA